MQLLGIYDGHLVVAVQQQDLGLAWHQLQRQILEAVIDAMPNYATRSRLELVKALQTCSRFTGYAGVRGCY
jgi:hypothetical protein